MMGNSQMNNAFLLESKPYLTKQEVGFLLQKKGKNLDKKISLLLKKGDLLHLKKGLYSTKVYADRMRSTSFGEYLANIQYYPSYLSLEYVLQKEGIIPEAVYGYTSISPKPTQRFVNDIGTFIYRSIKEPLFTGYQLTRYTEQYRIKIATRAKALFDLLYLKPLPPTLAGKKQEVLDLRINWDMFGREDRQEFNTYARLSCSNKMKQVANIILKCNYDA